MNLKISWFVIFQGVTLNSNKTVNISHHPNAKLASKTNVIVIQKGQTKGVTLSHAGKVIKLIFNPWNNNNLHILHFGYKVQVIYTF